MNLVVLRPTSSSLTSVLNGGGGASQSMETISWTLVHELLSY